MLLEKEKLPFPIGIATAETIESSEKGGIKVILMGITLLLSAGITVIRDSVLKMPLLITGLTPKNSVPKIFHKIIDFFGGLSKHNININLYVSPLATAIGYMVGPLYTLVMFIGSIFAFFFLVPLGMKTGLFPSIEAAEITRQTIGLGLMVGAGLGVLLKFAIEFTKKVKSNLKEKKEKTKLKISKKGSIISLTICAISFVFCIAAGLSPIISVLVLLGVFASTLMSALITGQAGIDPLEIFGILIMIAIRFLVPNLTVETSLLIAAAVAVTSGFVGDTMFDYKTGHIFGTNPKAQLISQAVGGVVGVIVASFTIFIIINNFGPDKLFVSDGPIPAPQASFVFGMINGTFNPVIFWTAALIGASWYVSKIPSITLGIGMYLPFGISFAVFIGGVIRFIVDKLWKKQSENGMIAASRSIRRGKLYRGYYSIYVHDKIKKQ